ncbi:hypothetical protein DER46DRAFT_665623 [Fusarium sp. MPI-SDFR-AT-0072]|nr:hypothetical protein DER46DRAFT_665623 [Fusarium sp. MPI-SDFR-AT-0072]
MNLTLLFLTAISMATFAIGEAVNEDSYARMDGTSKLPRWPKPTKKHAPKCIQAGGRNPIREFYGLGNCEDDCLFKERNGGANARVTAACLGGESGLSTPNIPYTTAMLEEVTRFLFVKDSY